MNDREEEAKIYEIHLRGFTQDEWDSLKFAQSVLGLSSRSATIFALLRDLLSVYQRHMSRALERIALEQKKVEEKHANF